MKKVYALIAFSAFAIFAQEEQEESVSAQEEQIQEQEESAPAQEEQVYSQQPQEQSSETASQNQGESVPKNTIILDLGPTIIGVGVGIAGDALIDEADASGFGFGLQYERQIFERLSVAGRFAYLGFGLGFSQKEDDLEAKLEASLSSFSIESHVRTYPFGGSFFLDGSLGYANMSANFKGEVILEDNDINGLPISTKRKESATIDASRSYFKSGIKLGWRVDFGEPGGFIFEHGFGYYFATASGKTIEKQFADDIARRFPGEETDISDLGDATKVLEDFIFVGGPRYTFAFGWRF